MQYSGCFTPIPEHFDLITASSPLTSFSLEDFSILCYLVSSFQSMYHSPELHVHIPTNKGKNLPSVCPQAIYRSILMMDMRTKSLPEGLSSQLHPTSRQSPTPLKFTAELPFQTAFLTFFKQKKSHKNPQNQTTPVSNNLCNSQETKTEWKYE